MTVRRPDRKDESREGSQRAADTVLGGGGEDVSRDTRTWNLEETQQVTVLVGFLNTARERPKEFAPNCDRGLRSQRAPRFLFVHSAQSDALTAAHAAPEPVRPPQHGVAKPAWRRLLIAHVIARGGNRTLVDVCGIERLLH